MECLTWSLRGIPTSISQWITTSLLRGGVIGNPLRATKEKGEEAFRRLSEHVARGVLELMEVPVEVHTRAFVDRVM